MARERRRLRPAQRSAGVPGAVASSVSVNGRRSALAVHPTPAAGSDVWNPARPFVLPRSLWPIAAVVTLYIVAMAIIPVLAPVAISDDWTYTRSVEILVQEGRFHILPVAAATMVFQLGWGALFALVFGLSFGVLRLSTVILTLVGGLAFYGLCREVGIDRQRSALGTLVYLFNPVLFAISYSFMSDPHFLALLVIASYFYVRGLRPGIDGERAMLVGSVVSAIACLQRPHGALIPLGVALYLVLSKRLSPDASGLRLLARVVVIPALTTVTYYLLVTHGVPSQQGYFLDEAVAAGWGEGNLLVRRLTFIEAMYIGLWVGPILIAALPWLWRLLALGGQRTWLLLAGWEGIVVGGLVAFWKDGRRMPYTPHFFGRSGPGSGDLRAARPAIASPEIFDFLTVACAVAAFIFGIVLVRTVGTKQLDRRAGVGMILSIGVLQVVGVVPQSLLFRNWIISLDRYLLPLLPFALCLLLWALRDVRLLMPVAWGVAATIAVFSIAGTRDVLVFQENVWDVAHNLNAQGVPNTRIDAGYAWDAYHLWEYSDENKIPKQTPDGTWWTDVYAAATDSTYVIAGGPLPGYDVVSEHPYSAWLQRQPVSLFVLRRQGVPGPP